MGYETLLEAFMTATEAKTVALNDLKIPSQYSNGYATGTGTDGLCVFSNLESDNALTNAGKHSKLGELIGKCVIESIIKAVRKQVWISPKSQSNALVRLNRYSLDINEFYDSLDCDNVLSECDDEFYEYEDNLEELNYTYIMEHHSFFE